LKRLLSNQISSVNVIQVQENVNEIANEKRVSAWFFESLLDFLRTLHTKDQTMGFSFDGRISNSRIAAAHTTTTLRT